MKGSLVQGGNALTWLGLAASRSWAAASAAVLLSIACASVQSARAGEVVVANVGPLTGPLSVNGLP